MKFTFDQTQVNILVESLDIAVKQIGLRGIYSTVELLQVIQNPVEHDEEKRTCVLTEEQVKTFNEILDITVKAVGLNAAVKIMDIIQVFQNPIQEEVQEVLQEE